MLQPLNERESLEQERAETLDRIQGRESERKATPEGAVGRREFLDVADPQRGSGSWP